MTLTPEQFETLVEAGDRAPDDYVRYDDIRAMIIAILPLHRAMVIEEMAARIKTKYEMLEESLAEQEPTDFANGYSAGYYSGVLAVRFDALVTTETKP